MRCRGTSSRQGEWGLVLKDTRMPVAQIFDQLAHSGSLDDLVDWYGLDRDQLKAVLEFVARSLDVAPSD
jgi:uncharacterized protein (DUF433 family)